jgi:hypothetical protein
MQIDPLELRHAALELGTRLRGEQLVLLCVGEIAAGLEHMAP